MSGLRVDGNLSDANGFAFVSGNFLFGVPDFTVVDVYLMPIARVGMQNSMLGLEAPYTVWCYLGVDILGYTGVDEFG